MGFPTQTTCLACGTSGPFPCPATGGNETSFEVHGRYGGRGMFKCRKCGAFNVMKMRLLFESSFVDVIRPDDPRHERIAKMHDQLFAASKEAEDTRGAELITETLRRLGANVTLQDLVEANSAGGSAIEFAALDRATAIVFDRRVKDQARLLAGCFPSGLPLEPKALLMTVGGHVFVGLITGRRLFGTHRSIVGYSGDAADAAEKATLLESLFNSMPPADMLEAAGKQFEDFFARWAALHAGQGIYADIPKAGAGGQLIYIHLLNGWSLSIAEYQMTL